MAGTSEPINKNVILEVKPLRTLRPIFLENPSMPPLVFTPPSGPFPAGFFPFYPFNMPQMSNPSMQSPVNGPFQTPVSPVRTVPASFPNGERGSSAGKPLQKGRKSSQKKARRLDIVVSSPQPRKDAVKLSEAQRNDGDREVVNYVLVEFDALRRRLCQIDDRESSSNYSASVHLKAGTIFSQVRLRTNMRKRIGVVPGVEIGDIYFYRMEMYLIGLHCQPMAGIDYMTVNGGPDSDTVAVSIVSSGKYDDDAKDGDILIYTGQGGNSTKEDKQGSDQKLERGNLALERSVQRGNEVRVIRGMRDGTVARGKVYVYDGLYRIQESWTERAKSGGNTFKYKLVRLPGQPDIFNIWKSVEMWRENPSSRPGLISLDLTSGAECIPVSLVNDIDGERELPSFTYYSTLVYSKSFSLAQPHSSCNCHNACQPGNSNCHCIQKNGGEFPYTANGILVCRRPLVYECGPTCSCFPGCKNRVSQTGLKARLEVFKTADRGWGLRSWDPIRPGTFICEYGGEVQYKNDMEGAANGGASEEYTFDATRIYNPFKWNYEPGLAGEESSGISTEEPNIPYPLTINSKNVGNVARFMNHSCSPNVFWQPVLYEHTEQSFVHIAFFAMHNIPPLTELTFDYGVVRPEGNGDSGVLPGAKKCLCGSAKCRGIFVG